MRELHPVGMFLAEVIDHGTFEANTGTLQLGIMFKTEAGKVAAYLPFTDRAIEHTLKKVAAIGYSGPLENLNDGVMIGMKCKITVEHETDQNNELKDKVSWINPVDYEGGIKKSQDAALKLKKFNAMFAKHAPAPVVSDESDIPF